MRKERIEKLMAATIGSYIQEHISLADSSFLITITKVVVAPSLELAQIHVSILGAGDKETFLQEALSQHHRKIKQYVAQKLGRQLRRVPREIRFYLDESPERASKLSVLINHSAKAPDDSDK